MRIALVTPVAFPSVRGNAVTVGRLVEGLRRRGVAAAVVDLSRTPPAEVERRLDAFGPAVVHAFHAFRGAPVAARFAGARGLPLVISLTGTDVNIDLFHAERRAATIAVVRAAQAMVAFHDSLRVKLVGEVPETAPRVEVIPQSVTLGDESYPLEGRVARRPGEVRLLLPAGIRRVKNVLFPLGPLGRLAARHPLRLLVVGPIIEPDEGARLLDALTGLTWAGYLGEVPHGQMASLLDQIEVVINSSLSEGGMANSVLEAMARGRVVLASDIEGNRSVIEDGADGLLFGDAESFERQAERLVRDPALRARLGAAARAKVARLYPPEREIEAHLALYRRLLAG
jgi:glycosyltransferase involved in cell wall biosynthesis